MNHLTYGDTCVPYLGRELFSPCKIRFDGNEGVLTMHERLALAFSRAMLGTWDDLLGPKPAGYDEAYARKDRKTFLKIMDLYCYAISQLDCPIESLIYRFIPYDPHELTRQVKAIAGCFIEDR